MLFDHEQPAVAELPIEAIRVEGRFRHDLGDIASLAASIDELGLLHPIVVTPEHRLIAGDRRLHAMRKLGRTHVPVRVTSDSLRSVYWGLRAPYRSNSTWLMSSATASVVDKLKTGTGDYFWRDSSSAGVPPTLLGRPVEISEDMPGISVNSYPILFGDFARAYIIVERPGLKLLRDPYTSKPNVIFYAYRRVGGARRLRCDPGAEGRHVLKPRSSP